MSSIRSIPINLGGGEQIEKIRSMPVSENLIEQAKQQSSPEIEQGRTPQMQEEFSNPTIYPGFQNLPQQEQQQRIRLSAFDPANISPTGTSVPPGTFESNPSRIAASVIPSFAAPEFARGSGILTRYAINPIVNALSRVGSGIASNVAYQAPEIKSKEDLKNVLSKSAYLNSILEAGTLPFRTANYFSEVFNPVNFAAQKAKQIQNEVGSVKNVMENKYKPVNEKYNDKLMTFNPEKYLSDMKINREDLYPRAQEIYDAFMKEPSFKNLHDLQSQLGSDWASISREPSMEEISQRFAQMRANSKNKLENYLSSVDKQALNQYKDASNYANNNYYPYLSTPTLRSVAAGHVDVDPSQLENSIKSATRKRIGKENRSVIPDEHPLRNHLKDLKKMNEFGKAAQYAVPTVGGGILGEFLHPGLGGAGAGAISTLGASQLAKIASKFGGQTLTDFMQNPFVQKIFENTSPVYYGIGRGATGYYSGNR